MQCFERMKTRVLGLAGLSLCLFCANSFAADTANYDTAWTYVYDGGRTSNGTSSIDQFFDVKILPNGDAICVGESQDSVLLPNILILKISPAGVVKQKKLLK